MRDESRKVRCLVLLTTVYFALNFAKNGGRIRLQNYLAMPHTFHIFQKHPSAITSFREYAKFIQHVGSGKTIETQMQVVSGKGIIATHPLDLEEYSIAFTQEEVCHANTITNIANQKNGRRNSKTMRETQVRRQIDQLDIGEKVNYYPFPFRSSIISLKRATSSVSFNAFCSLDKPNSF